MRSFINFSFQLLRLRNKKWDERERRRKMKRSFLHCSNKRKAISLVAIVYDFLWFVFSLLKFPRTSARPYQRRPAPEICFDFPFKLFAFMINYEIPLMFFNPSFNPSANFLPLPAFNHKIFIESFSRLIVCHSIEESFLFKLSEPNWTCKTRFKRRHFNIIKLQSRFDTQRAFTLVVERNSSSDNRDDDERDATILFWIEKCFPCW